MENLVASWGYISAILVACSLYFCWKINGGSIINFDKQSKNGADVIGAIFVLIGYIGFSVGMVGIAAVVGAICRILLLVIAVGAANAGDYVTASAAVAMVVGTGVLSVWAYQRSQNRHGR